MKLEEIGFYTLSDMRARQTSSVSPLWRCELVLTDKCNLQCPYCRGLKSEYHGAMPWYRAAYIIAQWKKEGLKNIRFSGGEPTLYKGLSELVMLTALSCEKIAISTNGTATREQYDRLLKLGVNDISVSLDACCSSTCDKMTGQPGWWDKIVNNISFLAKRIYVTVGVVLSPTNESEIGEIVMLARNLNVCDIRIIPAAQWKPMLVDELLSLKIMDFPILNYRINNLRNGRSVRGISPTDSHRCWLALDDMAVVGNHHYPCIIYLREQGKPIGKFTTIREIRNNRARWVYSHDSHLDPICRNNCLDVCVDYNNKVEETAQLKPEDT